MGTESMPAPQGIEAGIDRTPGATETGTYLELVHSWIVTVDHKRLGILYICYALVFLLVAGVEALLIRAQLFFPHNDFISPFTFNRLFTMHGTTMVFLVGMPILFGFGNYLVPLMIGARDMAFPRLNAFSFWISAFAGLLLYYSFIGGVGLAGTGSAPDVAWFAYAPLTERAFSPGHTVDYWAVSLLASGIGSIGTAINFLATVFCMRCKGMTLFRMPLLPWLYAVVSFLVLVAVSPLTAAQAMLLIDRYLGGHFFDTQAGGSAILWAHFFWIFGHPEVYVLVLPAFAFANEIIPVFSRKAIFGYPAMVAASVGIAFISLSVWAHHMFTDRDDVVRECVLHAFDNAGFDSHRDQDIQLAGDDLGREDSFCDADAVFGSVSFPVSDCGADGHHACRFRRGTGRLHNSYFVVAHFHYVLVGAIVFMIFAALYYWYPKMTGRMLDERLGKWHFWLMVIGFHVTFDTMHFPGLLGMPRQIYTYEPDRGWTLLNQIISVGGIHPGHCGSDSCVQPGALVFSRRGSGAGSVGCVDAGVVDVVAAACI